MSTISIFSKKTIVTMMALMAMSSASAQFFIPVYIPATPKKNNNLMMGWGNDGKAMPWKDSYSNSMVTWKDHKLTWNDFQGRAKGVVSNTPNRDYIMHLSLMNRPFLQKQKNGKVTYMYYQNESLIDTSNSWVVDSCKTDENLQLAQLDFNLWELYSRKAMIEYHTTQNASLDEMMDFYAKRAENRLDEIKESMSLTDDNTQKLKEINDEVENELNTLQIDPEKMVANLQETKGMYFDMGLVAHIPFSDYVSSGFGLNVGGGGFIKRHMIGVDVEFEFGGECKKPIHTDKGVINKGDKMLAGAITLQYGYNALRKSTFEMSPFCGFGVRFYDGGKKESRYQNNKGDEKIEKAGISFGIGCSFDFILSRQISIKTDDENIRKNTSGIGIKPYLSFSHFSGEMGWMPALNIAVDWDFTAFKLK